MSSEEDRLTQDDAHEDEPGSAPGPGGSPVEPAETAGAVRPGAALARAAGLNASERMLAAFP